jgi:hypothetical protein
VNSRLTDDFRACFARLPDAVQQQARRAHKLWRDDPRHPSLHFKRVHGLEDVWSVRIGLGWRALGVLDGDTITWFWIGLHADYDSLIG